MEQVYILSRERSDGTRRCLYRYGKFVYSGRVRVEDWCSSLEKLPAVLKFIQSIQSELPYLCEYNDVEPSSEEGKTFGTLEDVTGFVVEEVLDSEEVLQEALAQETWIDSENAELYFEFETKGSFDFQKSNVVIAKSFRNDVMSTLIYFQNRVLVTLTDASAEQALVDTLFPQVFGKQRGFQLRAYDHSVFTKLSVWEAVKVENPTAVAAAAIEADMQKAAEEEQKRAAAASEYSEQALEGSDGTEDYSGDAYTQIYLVRHPKHLDTGSTAREVLFRFGNWCYGGEVALGVDALHLGDVPDLLPALQRQQGRLQYLYEAKAVPVASPFRGALKAFLSAVRFAQEEIVSCEKQLEELSNVAVTSWIDAEWAASFFELKFEVPQELADVEVIACKMYGNGVTVHGVWFAGSLYVVLAETGEDQPLLDVAFPDVTARCRGLQLKSYPDKVSMSPRPIRLSVWEGRRRGAKGVGMEAGSLINPEIVQAAKARARHVEPKQPSNTAAEGKASASDAPAASSSPAPVEEVGEEKQGSEDVSSSDVAPVSGGGSTPSPSAGGSGGGSGAGDASGPAGGLRPLNSRSDLSGQAKVLQQARAPHHLPPMKGLGRLAPLGDASPGAAAAPWDKFGKPLALKK